MGSASFLFLPLCHVFHGLSASVATNQNKLFCKLLLSPYFVTETRKVTNADSGSEDSDTTSPDPSSNYLHSRATRQVIRERTPGYCQDNQSRKYLS